MDRNISVDEISDQFWGPPAPPQAPIPAIEDPKMKRSDSEWAFEMFLQEAATTSLSDTNPPLKFVSENDVVSINDRLQKNNSDVYRHESSQGLYQTNCAAAATQQANYVRSKPESDAPIDTNSYLALLEEPP